MIDLFHAGTLEIKIDERIVRSFDDIGNGEEEYEQKEQKDRGVQDPGPDLPREPLGKATMVKTVSDQSPENREAENERADHERPVFGPVEEIPGAAPSGAGQTEHGPDIQPGIGDVCRPEQDPPQHDHRHGVEIPPERTFFVDAEEPFDQKEDELREFSTPYEVSVYYDRLMDTELTGEYATDLLIVAFSQLGYHEGNIYREMHGCSKGSGNYSEYGRVMGANGQPWCASFISWCAERAGIPEDVITPSITACADSFGVEYHRRGEYVPKPGDIVIFDWLRNGLNDKEPEAEYGDHVGIVYRVTDKEMYYINGNGPDLKGRDTNCVKCLSRLLSDRNIKGYGVYTEEAADISRLPIPDDVL